MSQKEIKGTDGKSRKALYYVFPILKCYSDETFKPVKTGFFISPVGLFVTARYVFLDMVERDGSVYILMTGANTDEACFLHHIFYVFFRDNGVCAES